MNVYGQAMSDNKRDANSKVVRLALGAERDEQHEEPYWGFWGVTGYR